MSTSPANNMPTMPQEHNVQDDPRGCCADSGTTTTNDNSFSLQYAGEDSGANSQTPEAAVRHWYSMLDLNPKKAKLTAVLNLSAQGQKGPIVYTLQAIDQVNLRAIWERAASEWTHFNPGKIGSTSFKFNPDTPVCSSHKFNNLEYLNMDVDETRGSIEKRNTETRWIAALKKRSRYLIAEHTRQQEQHADDCDA
ncbi:hypothetical protein FN846DRAFT_904499 [Sphaerosporella brunnea]|uniref:Uncharacterized protein n=1 Tax=Sphaerosporella brunnea TaxID=1250544 RepID=A0A5J5F425_9PEZI|nr:hypothetical protein FN846DRAFT_904499 [Sphaerosporella brunnea]